MTITLVFTRSAWGHGRKWHIAALGADVSLCGIPVHDDSRLYYPDDYRSGVCAPCAHSVDTQIDLTERRKNDERQLVE